MRKIITILAITFMATTIFGQIRNYTVIGPKAFLGSVSIANQNNYGQKEMDYGLNFGYGAGIQLINDLSLNAQLVIEAMYQTGGQDYEDNFSNNNFKKNVDFKLIHLPIMYRYIFARNNDGADYLEETSRYFFNLGPQITYMSSAEAEYLVGNSPTDLLTFATTGSPNPNAAILEQLGNPEETVDLYNQLNLMFVAGIGIDQSIGEKARLIFELRGGISVFDINAEEWQLNNRESVYGASRHAFFGANLGIAFAIN